MRKNPRKVRQTKIQGPRIRSTGAFTAVVGTGVVAQHLTGRVPKRLRSRDGRSCEYGSTDYVGTVSVSNTNQIGDILFTLALNPLLVPATRTAEEAAQWERYNVKKWRMHLQALNGTMQNGQVIAFVDPDPVDVWSNTPLNMNKAAAQYGSVPDNVWKHFAADLPIVPGVADFYTNPSTSSDKRLSQCGIMRVVYAGGVPFPSGVTKVDLFNVYQEIDLMFYQPELSVTGTPALSSGKTDTPLPSNVLNGIAVSGAIPVNSTSSGVDIDTGDLGGNNIAAEIVAQVKSVADVASAIGIDVGIPSGALDKIQQVINMPQSQVQSIEEVVSQVLLPGDQSWSITPQTFGLQNANLLNATLNLFAVPSTVTSLTAAQQFTKLRKLRSVPEGATSGAMALWTKALPAGVTHPIQTCISSPDMEINVGMQVNWQYGSNEADITWTPSGIGEHMIVWIGVESGSDLNMSQNLFTTASAHYNLSLVLQHEVSASDLNSSAWYLCVYQVAPTYTHGQVMNIVITDPVSLGTQQFASSITIMCCAANNITQDNTFLKAKIGGKTLDQVRASLQQLSLAGPSKGELPKSRVPGDVMAKAEREQRFSQPLQDEDEPSEDEVEGFCQVVPQPTTRKVRVVARGSS